MLDVTHKRYAELIVQQRKKEAKDHPISHCVQEATFPIFQEHYKNLGTDVNRAKIFMNIIFLVEVSPLLGSCTVASRIGVEVRMSTCRPSRPGIGGW